MKVSLYYIYSRYCIVVQLVFVTESWMCLQTTLICYCVCFWYHDLMWSSMCGKFKCTLDKSIGEFALLSEGSMSKTDLSLRQMGLFTSQKRGDHYTSCFR